MTADTVICSGCGLGLQDEPGERPPCPRCGGTARTYSEHVTETVEAHESTRVAHKRPSVRTDKPIFEGFQGIDARRDPNNPGLVLKKRWLTRGPKGSREGDYYELVVDRKTGEVLREVAEPLAKHVGRGSARKKPKPEGEAG